MEKFCRILFETNLGAASAAQGAPEKRPAAQPLPRKTDPIILAADCVIDGGIGKTLPNYNTVAVGGSGTGKSHSISMPTMLSAENGSIFANYAKPGEGWMMAGHFRRKGYKTQVLDLNCPEKSTVGFDPLRFVKNIEDIEELASQSIHSVITKTVDDYWQRKAAALFGALCDGARLIRPGATMADVLELFDRMQLSEQGYGITTGIDGVFEQLKRKYPDSYAVREFYNFHSLPVKTASCVRDTAAACLAAMYPASIRPLMRKTEQIDFRAMATEKTAQFIITSPVNASLGCFADLVYGVGTRELLRYAAECPDYRLPLDVRLIFDDFAASSKIQNFAGYISIFRSAGISALILLQSESQLYSMYGEQDGKTILNNVSTYCYFSGGMDLTTCENVAKRMNKSLESVLYSPMDQVYIMQSGQKPRISTRYPILTDERYLQLRREDQARV